MGLFLQLKLLFTRGTQLRTRSVDKWNAFVPEQSYYFNRSRMKGRTTIELSVNPVNAEQVKQRKEQLTDADKSYLNEFRLKYIAHCNLKDTSDDNDDAEHNDCATKKERDDCKKVLSYHDYFT